MRLPGGLSLGVVLPLLLGVAFVLAIVQGGALPRGAGNSAVALGWVGVVLLVAYAVNEARLNFRAHSSATARQRGSILDISSSSEGLERATVRARTLRVLGGMAVLFVAVWVLSFHIALPLYLAIYLRRWAGASWRMVAITAVVFEVLIVVFYGLVIRVPWHESLLEQARGFPFQGLAAPLERLIPTCEPPRRAARGVVH